MRKILLLIILFCGASNTGYNQHNKPGTIALKYAPTSLLNPVYPAIHMAVECKITGSFSIQPEFGLLLKHHLLNKNEEIIGWDSYDSENNGFFIKVDFRKYFLRDPSLYGAAQVQFIKNNYKRTDEFDASPELTLFNQFCSTCVSESYTINKTAIGLNLKIGYQKEIIDRIIVDFYGGLGINYLTNKHSVNSELHKNPAVADGLITYYQPHYPGSYIYPLPTLAIGVKIGYVIK